MLTKTFKIFILSTILIFSTLFNVNSIFAQENKQITYDSVTCSNFELCNKEPGSTNIPQETQFFATNITNRPNSQDIFNYLCKQKSKNPNAIYISHTEENGHTEPLLAFAYENNGEIKYLSVNSRPIAKKSIKTLTCEIPPTEREENQNNQNQQTPPNEPVKQVIGCMDNLAINHNIEANVHDERSCIYPTVEKPYEQKDITGYIENTQVQSGATIFNLTLNLNTTGAIIDTSKIQIWNQFTPINSVTQDNKIIITFQKFNGQRLDIECNSYELTIPKNSITRNIEITENNQIKQIIEKNSNPITGNFIVVGCSSNTQNQDGENQDEENQNTDKENKATNINNAELDENKTYLPVISQKDGVFYIDIKAVAFLILFILITFSFSYVIYKLFTKKY